MDTKLEASCEFSNCTLLKSPDANILSPIAMSLTGVFGNAIAIGMVRRMKQELNRTVFYVLVAGLAWADLVGIVVTTPIVLLNYIYRNGSSMEFFGGSYMCNYHAFTMILFGILTPMIACAMAIERYIGIRHGYFYISHLNPLRARLTLLGLWLAAILFSSMPIFGFGQYVIQHPGTWCFCNIHSENPIDAAYSVTFAVLNLILITVMIVCNIAVQYTLVMIRCGRSQADHPDQFRRTHRNRQQAELEVQMTVVLLAITLVFTLCWVPLQIQILLNQFYKHRTAADHAGDLLAIRLASINQTLDPWVYIFSKKICLRSSGCMCWKIMIGSRWESFRKSCSLRDFTLSSVRSHLSGGSRNQESRRNPSAWKSRETTMERACVENVEAAVLMMPVDSQDVSSVYVTVPDESTNNSSTFDATHLGISHRPREPDVPIPIFSSSQYFIKRSSRSEWYPQHQSVAGIKGQYRRQSLVNSTKGHHCDIAMRLCPMTSEKGSISGPMGSGDWGSSQQAAHPARRRRHSWCCADADPRLKYYATQSTQTIEETETKLPI